MYNYSVGHEHGLVTCEKIARHLYETLDTVFPEKEGALLISSKNRYQGNQHLSGYLNAYLAIGLSRYARTFGHRPALERAIKVYHQLDERFTDSLLAEKGTWDVYNCETFVKSGKTDNAHIHRCEAALNILHSIKTIAPDLLDKEEDYLCKQIEDLTTFFDIHIAVPEQGFTIEHLKDDSSPSTYYRHEKQSLAHGFEWLGFCLEIERHTEIKLPFMQDRMKTLSTITLANGLAPNGCFRNEYIPALKKAPLSAMFWPQVEAILGALWARKRWGEEAFPFEKAERMMNFYQSYFFKADELGGGILSRVSENGVPTNYGTGHTFKCDHHAVRMIEKIFEYDLLGEVPR